ncbi:MAG: M48 family metalloprotease [Gemmatimonadaceae bacterium]|nr:M48 family metalloprotease [Gemmatimonadaceae bacterium]
MPLRILLPLSAAPRLARRLALGAALSVAATGCATNPATGRRELSLIPQGQEIAMGQEGAKAAAAQMGIYPDSGLQRYVSGLGLSIAKSSERPDLPWSFSVVDDPIVNAFALPGGPVFVSRGILAHMNSEAQLVSVLGHEAGHVTAKHSVSQMSKQQILQIGLIGAMVLKPELQQFGDVASQGLGVLFLKFSRDDEIQADELGFRYMTAKNYAPTEMAEMFKTLQRVSGGAGARGTPEWLSTHPDPGNRVEKTAQRMAAAGRSFTGSTINRDVYLRRIDGMIFGEDPRAGYFQQTTFIQPTMQFRFDFPTGWRTQNSAEQVIGASAQGDAQVALTLAGNVAPQAALQKFLQQQGVRAGQVYTNPINGNTAAIGQFAAQTQDGKVLAGYVAYIQQDGITYQLLAITLQQSIQQYDGVFRNVIGSFQRVTDPRLLTVTPQRVRIVQLPSAMSLTQFNQQYPSVIPIAQLALINAMDPAQVIPAGTLVKRVVVQ